MVLLDIIHLEDEEGLWRFPAGRYAAKMGMGYLGVGSLELLEISLNGISAKVYILDGVFPRTAGGLKELLAEEAMHLVRSKDPSATIFLHTATSTLEPTAERFGARFYDKVSCDAEKIIKEAKPYIERYQAPVAQPQSLTQA